MASTYSGQSIASTMQSNAQACRQLSSKVSELTAQSTNSLEASQAGQNCNSLASAMPQNMGFGQGDSSDPQSQQQLSDLAAQCAANPALAGCQQAAAGQAAIPPPADGELASFRSSDASDPGKFALPEQSGLDQPEFTGVTNGPSTNVPTVNTIANNSGGGIPGAGGSSGQAQLGTSPSAASAASARGTTSSTDIDQGFRSGGYAAAAAGLIDPPAGNGSYGGRRIGSSAANGRDPSGLNGLDLKKYLPGGSLAAPQAGGLRTQSREIQGPYVNIWDKISERYQEKCRLGELYDCK
jgi:hypothetical protein